MFSCGWLPPVGKMQAGLVAVVGVALYSVTLAHRLFSAAVELAAVEEPTGTWLCAGISEMLRVCADSPPSSPRAMPLPTCTGERPCRLGRAKFTRPSPP